MFYYKFGGYFRSEFTIVLAEHPAVHLILAQYYTGTRTANNQSAYALQIPFFLYFQDASQKHQPGGQLLSFGQNCKSFASFILPNLVPLPFY